MNKTTPASRPKRTNKSTDARAGRNKVSKKRTSPARGGKVPFPTDGLLARAEAVLKKRLQAKRDDFPADGKRLIHELMTHQIELEIQNEELRAAQLQLEESRERFQDLYDFAPAGYFSIDEGGAIIGANLTCATMLGIERDKLIKTSFFRYITRDSSDIFYPHHKKVVESGEGQTCEIKCLRKNGSPFYASLRSDSSHDKTTRIVMSDITEQRQAEQSQREVEERFRLIAETSIDVIFQAGVSGKVTYVSPAVSQYGYSPDQIMGSDFKVFIANDSLGIAEAAFKRAISGEYIKSLEITILMADGTPAQTEINITPITLDGNIIGLQGMARDIAERKKAEEVLKLSNAELSSATAKLLEANEQLLSQTKELSKHREHLSELVEKRTSELTDSIARLNAEIAERRQAEESLKESDRQIRHLSSQLLAAQEVERKRISMELHDALGQALNGVKLHVRAIERSLSQEQSTTKEDCEHLLGYIDQIIEDVRRLSLDLSPSVLDDLGVTSALKWLTTHLKNNPTFNVTWDIGEIDDFVPESQWIVVYRVL